MQSAEPPETDEYRVAIFLKENGLSTAYATFENASVLTLLTDGDVCVAAVASVEKMNICKWLSSSKWYVPNVPYEEKTAYVITEAQMDEFQNFLNLHEDELRFETQVGKFYIYESDYNFSCLD